MDLVQEMVSEAVEHSGVKGQKWGVRNYQNPDGTYTELGKKRRRVGYKEEATEDETKIGGKAYKDMTWSERRAAKKRARHNEAERKQQREFNREKKQAIQEADLEWITKNIGKFTNEELVEIADRYRKMQVVKDMHNQNKKTADTYIDKALKYLDKAAKASDSISKIYNNITESNKKSLERDKLKQELANMKKPKTQSLKDYYEQEKSRYVMENQKNATEANLEKLKRAAKKEELELEKLRNDRESSDIDLRKKRREEQEEKDRIKQEKKQYKENAEKHARYREARIDEIMKDYKVSRKEAERQYDREEAIMFSGQKKDQKMTGLFSRNKNDNKSTYDWNYKPSKKDTVAYDDLDKLTQKYLKSNQEKLDTWTKNRGQNIRDSKWMKEAKKGDSTNLDKWVKEMTEKYRVEGGLSKEAAEKKAEAYVDAWVDAYDEGRITGMKKK